MMMGLSSANAIQCKTPFSTGKQRNIVWTRSTYSTELVHTEMLTPCSILSESFACIYIYCAYELIIKLDRDHARMNYTRGTSFNLL